MTATLPAPPQPRPHGSRGVSILELAIVLIIIGMVAGLLSPLLFQTARSGKVRQGREAMEALRMRIIGHVVSDASHTLPQASDPLFDENDVWGRAYGFFPAPSLSGLDICDETGTGNADLTVITPNQTVGAVAFVLTSDGPDHTAQITATPTQVDGSAPLDDLMAFVTFYQLYRVVCGKDHSTAPGAVRVAMSATP